MDEVKIIKIEEKTSIIEGNLAEMPMIRYNRGNCDNNIANYPWSANGKEYNVEIRGSAKYGLPNEFDFDVLLALLRLYAKQKTIEYQKLIENDSEIPTEDATLYFTLNELAKELKKSTGGKNIKRLQESIETLKDTSIHGQFYDKYKGKYVAKVKKGMSIITDYQFYELQEDEKGAGWRDIKEQTYVIFNKFYVRSIHNTYFKYFNYEQYLNIGKSGIAKKLYLLLCKWRNSRSEMTLRYETLFTKIPLDTSKPHAYNKRILKNAFNKLVENNIINDFTFDKESVSIMFVKKETLSKKNRELLNKFNLFEQIQEWFFSIGFSHSELSTYMNTIVYEIEYVKALIRYVEDNKTNIKDVKAYVSKGLRLPYYKIEKRYYNKTRHDSK